MSDVFVAVESCGCVAGATVLRRPDAVRDFLNEMGADGCEVITMPVEEFRTRPTFCQKHPNGPPHWGWTERAS